MFDRMVTLQRNCHTKYMIVQRYTTLLENNLNLTRYIFCCMETYAVMWSKTLSRIVKW